MKLKSLALAAAMVAAGLSATAPAAFAQEQVQFFPALVYRTGPYAPNGVPAANGFADYVKLINARGGINGIKILLEECEFGYATAKGVECYERLKGQHGGATAIQPLSTGVTYALTEKAPADKVPIITVGYGNANSADGMVFKWNFPLIGTYWVAADVLIQHIAKQLGGFDKLKGKKIAHVYHDSPYGKEPIALLEKRAQLHGFELMLLPVKHPGVEQKATWLQIRRERPDFVLLWGWGVMNSTAIKEAVATGYPRDQMYGVWWAGAEPDVVPAGDGAKGYNALALQASTSYDSKVTKDVLALVHDKGNGTGPREEVGTVLYTRGLMLAMLEVEGVKRAQERFGKGKHMTGEQVRWGLENLDLTQAELDSLGFAGLMRPVSTSCADHMGAAWARIQTWDGQKWNITSDWYQADQSIIKPMVKESAQKYAAEKNLPPRTDCSA